MSNNEWERGTFKLPSSEFASFRQTIQDLDRKRKEKAFAITQDVWKGLTRKQQSDPDAYRQALADRQRAEWDAEPRYVPGQRINWSTVKTPDPIDESAKKLAEEMLNRKSWAQQKMVDGIWRNDPDHKPSRILASEMDYPTNRTTSFHDGDAGVYFDKDAKTVTWATDHNNHSVEHAHQTPLAAEFFKRLDQVRWTHGTGGCLAYHSEYHDEDRSVGAGGNTCNGSYGYIGIAEQPSHVRPFTNAKGERIAAEAKFDRLGRLVGKPIRVDSYGRPMPKAPVRRPASTPAGTARGKTTASSNPGSFKAHTTGVAPDLDL